MSVRAEVGTVYLCAPGVTELLSQQMKIVDQRDAQPNSGLHCLRCDALAERHVCVGNNKRNKTCGPSHTAYRCAKK